MAKIEKNKHEAEQYVRFVAIHATPRAMNTHEVEQESAIDDGLEQVRRALKTGCFDDCKAYAPIAGELCVIGKLVLRGTCHTPPDQVASASTGSGTRRTPGHCRHESEAQNENMVARHG